jgi:hypothetical protein
MTIYKLNDNLKSKDIKNMLSQRHYYSNNLNNKLNRKLRKRNQWKPRNFNSEKYI